MALLLGRRWWPESGLSGQSQEAAGWPRLLGPGHTSARASGCGIWVSGWKVDSEGGGGRGLESRVPRGTWTLGLSTPRHPLPRALTRARLAAQTTSPSS